MKDKIIRKIYSMVCKNHEVSIISNNCWGAMMASRMGVRYNSPFAGLFLFAPDYINLLKNPNIIYGEMTFIDKNKSKYRSELSDSEYPIGLLTGGVEVHFLHYRSEKEAIEKWERRVKRVNWKNLLVKFCDRDLCTPALIREFCSLPYEHKVCFSSKNYPELNCVVQIKNQSECQCVHDEWKAAGRYYNLPVVVNELIGVSTPVWHRLLLWVVNHL